MQTNHFFQQLHAYSSVLIACSGGSDSMCLLDKLLKYKSENNLNLDVHVLYVHHGISIHATSWGKLVSDYCAGKNVIFHQHELNLGMVSETKARQKRHEVFFDYAQKHDIAVILTGHHQDDLKENLLISVFKNRVHDFNILPIVEKENNGHKLLFMKPLLSLNKQEIQTYCVENDLPYVVDESNHVSDNLRNVLRNELFAGLKSLETGDVYENNLLKFFEHYQKVNDHYNEKLNLLVQEIMRSKKQHKENEVRYVIELKDLSDDFVADLVQRLHYVVLKKQMANHCLGLLLEKLPARSCKAKYTLNQFCMVRFSEDKNKLFIFLNDKQ